MFIKVRVTSGSKKESISRIGNARYEIAVREPAERNLANNRIRELIAREFGTVVAETRIISGHRSTAKIISVDI